MTNCDHRGTLAPNNINNERKTTEEKKTERELKSSESSIAKKLTKLRKRFERKISDEAFALVNAVPVAQFQQKMAQTLAPEPLAVNFKETELCLALPGGIKGENESLRVTGKRGFEETIDLKLNIQFKEEEADLDEKTDDNDSKGKNGAKPPAKAQVVGWPPVRSYRKNSMMIQKSSEEIREKGNKISSSSSAMVKVCMDGAPYLRKVDLKMYKSYQDLSDALAKMFSSFTMGEYGTQGMIDFMNDRKLMDLLNSSEYVPTYEDKDGDWMLVGDVPWQMFVDSCKRVRIMKGSEAIGLAPRAMEKCKSSS